MLFRSTISSCCRLLDTNHLQLGRGRDNEHEMPANKMQEEKIEAIRLWVYPGIVLPGMTTNFSVLGGHSPNTTGERTTDGSMGSSDAKGRGRSTDVLETRII